MSMSNTNNLKCIENLLNIEKNKSNDNNILKIIIDSFISELQQCDIYYLYNKYLTKIENENYNDSERPCKKRRLCY